MARRVGVGEGVEDVVQVLFNHVVERSGILGLIQL